MQKINKRDISDFEKACKNLSNIIDRIKKYCPEATIYATPDQLNLMSCFWDDSESGQENSLVVSCPIQMETGDW